MKTNTKALIFILNGIYAFIGIYFSKKLVFTYQYGSDGIDMLPINFFEILLFAIAIVIVAISFLSTYLLTKKRKPKLSGNFNIQIIVTLLLGGITLYLLVQNGFNNLLVPVALIYFGILLLNINRQVMSNLKYLAFAELILGILAFIIFKNDWLLLYLSFGILPIIYGIFLFFAPKKRKVRR